jgi:hypothetical protein
MLLVTLVCVTDTGGSNPSYCPFPTNRFLDDENPVNLKMKHTHALNSHHVLSKNQTRLESKASFRNSFASHFAFVSVAVVNTRNMQKHSEKHS